MKTMNKGKCIIKNHIMGLFIYFSLISLINLKLFKLFNLILFTSISCLFETFLIFMA